MLSEKVKRFLKLAIQLTIEFTSLEECQKEGPVVFVEKAINGKSKGSPEALEIAANREEAERYLAGLMGMM